GSRGTGACQGGGVVGGPFGDGQQTAAEAGVHRRRQPRFQDLQTRAKRSAWADAAATTPTADQTLQQGSLHGSLSARGMEFSTATRRAPGASRAEPVAGVRDGIRLCAANHGAVGGDIPLGRVWPAGVVVLGVESMEEAVDRPVPGEGSL